MIDQVSLTISWISNSHVEKCRNFSSNRKILRKHNCCLIWSWSELLLNLCKKFPNSTKDTQNEKQNRLTEPWLNYPTSSFGPCVETVVQICYLWTSQLVNKSILFLRLMSRTNLLIWKSFWIFWCSPVFLLLLFTICSTQALAFDRF